MRVQMYGTNDEQLLEKNVLFKGVLKRCFIQTRRCQKSAICIAMANESLKL